MIYNLQKPLVIIMAMGYLLGFGSSVLLAETPQPACTVVAGKIYELKDIATKLAALSAIKISAQDQELELPLLDDILNKAKILAKRADALNLENAMEKAGNLPVSDF